MRKQPRKHAPASEVLTEALAVIATRRQNYDVAGFHQSAVYERDANGDLGDLVETITIRWRLPEAEQKGH